MKKVYYLSTCSTCDRILKSLNLDESFIKQDIKTDPINETQIEEMKLLAGNYEALFSRRAMKFRSMGLNEMNLTEEDYKRYILGEYTFLKRPVFIIDNQIFIGSSKTVVEDLQKLLE